jgi:hypothetical protein
MHINIHNRCLKLLLSSEILPSNCNFSNLFEWNVPQLSHNSAKNRKYNDQAKKGKREYNNLQSTTQKTKDRVPGAPLKTREL